MIVKIQLFRDDGSLLIEVVGNAAEPMKWGPHLMGGPIAEGAMRYRGFDYTPKVDYEIKAPQPTPALHLL
jgi:hypothetical protein